MEMEMELHVDVAAVAEMPMETATAMANGVDNEVRPSHVWVQRQQQQHAQRQPLAPH